MRRGAGIGSVLAVAAMVGLACAGGDGADTGPAGGVAEGSLQLGEACSEDVACASGQCAYGACREGCRDWAECVGTVETRSLSCLYVPGMDVVQEFRPGACPTVDELVCGSDDDCPSDLNGCDPNGVCRAVCDTVDDCVNHSGDAVSCAGGFCYDGLDSGWSRVSLDQPVHEAPFVEGRIVFEDGALAEPMSCTMRPHTDPAFEPAIWWGWPFGQLGFSVECHRESDDQAFFGDEVERPAAVTFPVDPAVLGPGMEVGDIALCGLSEVCAVPLDWDPATGRGTWRHLVPVYNSTPIVAPHVVASVGGSPLECWVHPSFAGTSGEMSVRSWPASTAQIHRASCWPGSFEVRARVGTLATGTHDLSDPAVQGAVDVGMEVDGVVYGAMDGEGSMEGANGSVTYTVTADFVSIRLEDATLASEDGATVAIEEALLFVSP